MTYRVTIFVVIPVERRRNGGRFASFALPARGRGFKQLLNDLTLPLLILSATRRILVERWRISRLGFTNKLVSGSAFLVRTRSLGKLL